MEILATFVLIAIIIPVAMKGISLATAMAARSKRQLEAASLAKTKLAEILATKEWENGDMSGDFGQDFPDYRWAMETQDWTAATAIRQLDLHVLWDAQGRQRSVTLTTLVYTEDQ